MSISEQVKQIRQYVKDYRHPFHNQGVEIYGTDKVLEQAADTIEALSANLAAANMKRSERYYGDGWILCRERLPEIGNKTYLVTYRTAIGKLRVRDCFYGSLADSWSKKIGGEVIAWCELPEPYRP